MRFTLCINAFTNKPTAANSESKGIALKKVFTAKSAPISSFVAFYPIGKVPFYPSTLGINISWIYGI